MYAGDTGYFEYDDKYAPLCIKTFTLPSVDLVPILQSYYNETYDYGKKHVDAIQPSGISAGEAAFLLMIGRMTKTSLPSNRRKDKNAIAISDQDVLSCVEEIVILYKNKLHFDDSHAAILQHVLRLPNYYCHDMTQRIVQQVKHFMKQYRLTTKQYTKILRASQFQVSRIVEKFYGTAVAKSGNKAAATKHKSS